MGKQTIGVGTTSDDGTGDTLRAAFVKVNANTDELYSDLNAAQADATTGIADAGAAQISADAAQADAATAISNSDALRLDSFGVYESFGVDSTTTTITPDISDQGVLRLALSTDVTTPSKFIIRIKFDHPDQDGRIILISAVGLTSALIDVSDTSGLVTKTKTGSFVGPSSTEIGGVSRNNGETVSAINGTLAALDIVDSVANLYGDITYSVIRIPMADRAVGRYDYHVDLDSAEFGSTEFIDAMPSKTLTPVNSTVFAENHGGVLSGEPTSAIYRLSAVQGTADLSWIQIA